jgi:hypothetical protein
MTNACRQVWAPRCRAQLCLPSLSAFTSTDHAPLVPLISHPAVWASANISNSLFGTYHAKRRHASCSHLIQNSVEWITQRPEWLLLATLAHPQVVTGACRGITARRAAFVVSVRRPGYRRVQDITKQNPSSHPDLVSQIWRAS